MRFRGAWRLVALALVAAGCGGGNTLTTSQAAPADISNTPAAGSTGVAVTAPVTATFNQVMSATTFNASTFTLTPAGGTAVAGNVSYGAGSSTAVFAPASPLAYNTVYTATITTGVQNPAGTALGSSDTWSFTTATGPAPTVTAVTPGNGSTGLVANTTITATFSEAMKASTITASTFTLTPQGGAPVSATVSYNATTLIATLTPNAPLAANKMYTAAVTTGVVGATGSAIANVNSWSFTTAGGPVPTVSAVTPTSGTTNVAIASTVAATFSEAMDSSTITAGSTFWLTGGGASVTGTVSADPTNTIFTFTPSAPLAYNTTYTALITTGVQATSQAPVPEVPLAANYTWSFTTAPPPPAMVSAVTPASGSTGVPITGQTVTATFGAAMTLSTLNPSTFALTGPSGAVAGAVTYNATTFTATFTPSVSFTAGTTYTATIGTGATSSLGGPLPAPYTWSFTTAKGIVPTVTSVTPTSGTTNVSATNAVTATFSEPMNGATLTPSTFTLTATGFPVATGTVAYNTGTQTATFTPSPALAPNTTYTATITTGAQGATGAALASNDTWTFTTENTPSAVAVSFGTTYQTITGFGGSTAWLGQMPAKVATALFSPTSGLNLSILRVRIDPEGSASGGGAHNLPYETGEWDQEAANGAEAVANNPNAIVFATPWTPPATWKLNGSSSLSDDGATWNQSYNSSCGEGTGYCGGYLNPSDYANYATFLEDFVHFFNTVDGFNLYAVSMQNEPEENVTYESCVWTPEEMDTWVANNATTITSDPYHTKLIMPESDTFNPVDAAKTLSDPNAQSQVSIIGGHLYGVTPAPYSIPAGDSPKQVWMTEFGPLSGTPLTFAQALSPYGLSIHNSLVNGQYNAYVWWGLFGNGYATCSTAAGTCGFVDSNGDLQPMGEIMGQYSEFIQPGYVRASATATPVSGVYVSAYTGDDQSGTQHYVIVAINTTATVQNMSFTLSDAPTGIFSMTPTQSTSAAGLVTESAVTVVAGQFTYTLPAGSITTFVQ
jgi:O-glycosyl hydrolase